METYPENLDCYFHGDYSGIEDDGILTMKASDGSYKTHIKQPITSLDYGFTHRFINAATYADLMRFYRINKGREFLFNDPRLDRPVKARFKSRPQITWFRGLLRSVRVELVGVFND